MNKDFYHPKQVLLDKMVQIIPLKNNKLGKFASHNNLQKLNNIAMIKKNPFNTIKTTSKYFKKSQNTNNAQIHQCVVELVLQYKFKKKHYNQYKVFPKRQQLIRGHEKKQKYNQKLVNKVNQGEQAKKILSRMSCANIDNLRRMYFSTRLTKSASQAKDKIRNTPTCSIKIHKKIENISSAIKKSKDVDISPWKQQQKDEVKETFVHY